MGDDVSSIDGLHVDKKQVYKNLMAVVSAASLGHVFSEGMKRGTYSNTKPGHAFDERASWLGVSFYSEDIANYEVIAEPLIYLDNLIFTFVDAIKALYGWDSQGALDLLNTMYDSRPGLTTGEFWDYLSTFTAGVAFTASFFLTGGGSSGFALVGLALLAGGTSVWSTWYAHNHNSASMEEVWVEVFFATIGLGLAGAEWIGPKLAQKLLIAGQALSPADVSRVMRGIESLAGNPAFVKTLTAVGSASEFLDKFGTTKEVKEALDAILEKNPTLTREEAVDLMRAMAAADASKRIEIESINVPVDIHAQHSVPADPISTDPVAVKKERFENFLLANLSYPLFKYTRSSGYADYDEWSYDFDNHPPMPGFEDAMEDVARRLPDQNRSVPFGQENRYGQTMSGNDVLDYLRSHPEAYEKVLESIDG